MRRTIASLADTLSSLGLLFVQPLLIPLLGIALRGVMADVFAGIALGLEHTHRIGDWVELGSGLGGRVAEITWRATRIETPDKVHVIVPNGRIAQQRVTNYSAPSLQYRQQVRVTLDHTLRAGDARRLLAEAAAGAPA